MKIERLVESRLPTVHGIFRMIAFKSDYTDFPHLALVSGDIENTEVVNVRIHSECMTGDVFSSVRCDCGEQLNTSMSTFSKEGGILIYLRQEGRGIGLVNKMKAYNFQDEGMDTIEANHALGFHTDERDFSSAIQILLDLEIKKINLFTNNPEKVSSFDDSGVAEIQRKEIEIEPRKENERYLRTKLKGMGHFLRRV
jgi:3,4-dihydroxy 2-butanone 4-phosphate synthase/GTP cyclohydrolase II